MNAGRIVLQALLSISPLVAYSQSGGQWEWVAPYPPRLQAYSVDVVGDNAYFWCAGNLVMSVSDGGATFNVGQYATTEDVVLGCCNNHGIAFADSLVGYVTDIAYGQFRTNDGGRTWTMAGSAYSGFEMVEFGSSSVGWKVGDGGTYRTSNAGVSWVPVQELYSTGGVFSSMYSLDENRVWVMKSFHNGRPTEGSIWYSDDSGSSWTTVNTGIISDEENQITYYTMRIEPSGIGFAVGSIYHPTPGTREGFVLKTSDSGTSWSYTSLPDEQWEEVISVSDSVWLLAGNSGSYPDAEPILRRTTDMGGTWVLSTPFTTVNYNRLYSAAYLESSNKIIVITLQGLHESSDMGGTFSRITSDRDIVVTDVSLDKQPPSTSEQVVMAKTTYSRVYLLSTDGGSVWRRMEIPAPIGSEIWGTRIVQGQIFMITNQTSLHRSTDLGVSWDRLDVPGYALRALDVYDSTTIAVQSYQNLFTSSDAGTTWMSAPFPGTMWLNESSIITPGEVVAVGGFYGPTSTKGIIYRTTDNGLNWRIEDTQTQMRQMSMIDESVGFAMGENRLYKTTNSGSTWFPSYSTTGSYTLEAFCFENLTHGILREAHSTFQTFNGGTSWQPVSFRLPIEYTTYRMGYNIRGDLLVASNGRLLVLIGGGDKPIENPVAKTATPVLYQNHPNPFNPLTTISFHLPVGGLVELTVYDILGRRVTTILDEMLEGGDHSVPFDGSDLASGIYFFQLRTQSTVNIGKMVLVR